MQNIALIISSLSDHVRHWLATTDLTLLASQLAAAAAVGAIVYVALTSLSRIVSRKFAEAAARPAKGRTGANALLQTLSVMAQRTARLFIFIAAVTAASLLLPITSAQFATVHRIFDVALIVQAAIWASVLLSRWIEGIGNNTTSDYRALANAHAIIATIARVALWSIALMLVFDNLGFNVTALVTGLGIGGIAIGLAVQKILADLFASLAIVLDRPFEYGDFIVSGTQMGKVESIGLKTTRLRAPTGEQLVIANSDLLDSRIQNFKRMHERRVVFQTSVVQGTPADKLALIPGMIEEAVKTQELARFERSHLISFADAGLRFETSYLVGSPEQVAYMDCHQAILMHIYRRCTEQNIMLAMAIPGGLPVLPGAPGYMAPVPAQPMASPAR